MSQTEVNAFLESVSDDDALRQEWNACAMPADVVAIARRLGHAVSEEELCATLDAVRRAQSQELGEAELDRVAGGIAPNVNLSGLSFEYDPNNRLPPAARLDPTAAWPCKWNVPVVT